MFESLPVALGILASPYVLALSWIATILLSVLLTRLGTRMRGGNYPPDLIELELTIKPENFTHILKTWTERAGFEQSIASFRQQTRLDMLYAISYPFALSSLLAGYLSNTPLMGDGMGATFILAAFLAGLSDALIENRAYLHIIAGLSSPEDLAHIKTSYVQTAFLGAAVKWSLLAITLLAVLGGLVSKLFFSLQAYNLALVLPLITFLVFAYYSFILFPRAGQEYRGGHGENVIALQLSFTKKRFVEILRNWIYHSPSEDAIEAFRRHLRRLDYAFPVVYAVLFASLSLLLHRPEDDGVSLLLGLAFWLPFGAALFDMVENTIHYVILQQINAKSLASVPGTAVTWASVFASLKFLCLSAWLALTLWLFLAG